MRRIIFLIVLLAGMVSYAVQGQSIRNFTADPVKFLQEMQSFLQETNKKEGEKIMEDFSVVWNSGKLNTTMQQSVYKISNVMLRKRLKAFPDFRNFLMTIISFSNNNQPPESFIAWQASLERLLEVPTKHFSIYMVTCNNLFKSNSLYESASTNWHADNNNYTFDIDTLPKIIFPSLTLVCSAKGDSSVIRNTSGILYPTRQLFFGKGGKVSWIRAGWDEAVVRAELKNFVIDLTGSDFVADSAIFYNTVYFKQSIEGKYSDKLLANVSADNASYPRFESYTNNFVIRNIVPDLDYSGGFSMHGNRMIGSGTEEEKARLFFYRNKKPFMVAESRGFVVRKDKITSDHAAITMHLDTDSIYHPDLSLKYIVKDREVALISGEDGKSNSPFYNSFHHLDMYFDGMYWKIDEPIIDMKMISGAGESKASFESSNYFREHRFLRLQGLSEVHPLYILKQYSERHSTRVVYTEDLAKDMRLPPSEVRDMLIRFSNQGYVAYDGTEDKALIKDKTFYYLLANIGKTDYDVIQFESIINAKPNGSINLLNYDITLRGLAPIILSDSQNVVIYPANQEVKLKKDRDFTFSGRLHCGRFDFFGKLFAFDYHNFKINLENVDSLRLKVESDNPADVDEYGKRKLVAVRSVLEDIKGDLLIDAPGNKSGKHEFSQFPIFNSKKDSYVYYDKPWIQDGVYMRDTFYFHLDPFTIDSLDNFSRAGLRFDGELVSAGIFPEFRDTLKLRPDLSLGLVRETGAGGWPAYGGKGVFTSTVDLSNEGLHGDGTLDYLTSHSESDDYLFLPDSMNSNVDKFNNRKEKYKEVEFPAVIADTVYVHWEPKRDVMFVKRRQKDLQMFENQALLNGNLQLSPRGMTGEGIMTFAASELESDLFKYKSNVFDADTSDFRLTSDNTAALAFSTNNVKSHIDFVHRLGEFKSNGGGSYVSFPLNQYICFIDQFKWFMDQKEIELSSSGSKSANEDTASTGLSLTGSEFVSVEPHQDSLRWIAPFARYSLKDYLIRAEKVALIQTADATVIPDSGHVVIERYAKMRTLKDARIIANTITKYHSIYNASVDVLGRKRYIGNGDYDYIDENKIKHHFHFDKIGVDTTFQTIASGELPDSTGFPLSPQFLFKGDVHLTASKEYLTFSGYAMPNIHCEKIGRNWIKFTGDIDPSNVSIPIETPVTDGGTKLSAAIVQTSDSTGIYAAFLMPKQRASDLDMITAAGVLYFDKSKGQFCITTKEKVLTPGLPGNFLALDDSKCMVYGEGKVEFGSDFGQLLLNTVGNVTANLNNDDTKFDVLAAVDFYFNDDALKSMAEALSTSASLKGTQDVGRTTYEHGLTELVGKEKADKLISQMNLYGSFKKIPDELRHTIFFTELKLAWNNDTRTFRSSGPIGIGNIDKISVNRKTDGIVEIVHKRSGDVFNIYIEPEKGTWYYFSYARGLLQSISSLSVFNDYISKLKPEKRVNKEKGKPDFEYMLSTDRAVKNFLKKMQPETPNEDK